MTPGDLAWERAEADWNARILDDRRRARWLSILLVLAPHRKAAAHRLARTVHKLTRLRDRAETELGALNALVGMEEVAARGASRRSS